MTKISTVSDREKLKPRNAPYYQKISKGCFVGYRKLKPSASGTWIARCLPDGEQKQSFKALSDFSHLPDFKRFDSAQEDARKFFDHMGKGGSNEAATVNDVCSRYVEHLRDNSKTTTAKDVERRFKAYVLNNAKLSGTQAQKLTPDLVTKWRRELAKLPTKAGSNRGGERSASSLNRDMTCFRSALNLAMKDGLVTSDFAWREKLKQVSDADSSRDVYLDTAQRRAVAANAPSDLATLIQALSLLPVRPGALAQLKVGDYDRQLKTLRIGKDKTGSRKIALPDKTALFFEKLCESRMPHLPLLERTRKIRPSSDKPSAKVSVKPKMALSWNKDAWKKPFKAAVKAAELPGDITLYALRHSTITDLVHGGLDLLTVGQVSGTSQRMIEKHYGHLVSEQSRKALSMLSL